MSPIITPPPGGGSSPAGAPVVRAFSFAYNNAGLTTGKTFYAPTVGDVLLDAWFEVDTGWDGTTPFADIGTYLGGNHFGLFFNTFGPVNLLTADVDISGAPDQGYLIAANNASSLRLANIDAYLPGGPTVRNVPGKFTQAAPLKVVVSQTGRNDGASPGSSQGAGRIYLVTATPA